MLSCPCQLQGIFGFLKPLFHVHILDWSWSIDKNNGVWRNEESLHVKFLWFGVTHEFAPISAWQAKVHYILFRLHSLILKREMVTAHQTNLLIFGIEFDISWGDRPCIVLNEGWDRNKMQDWSLLTCSLYLVRTIT